MTTKEQAVAAVDTLLASDPDTLHGAIAVLFCEAMRADPDALESIGAAFRMLAIIHSWRESCTGPGPSLPH